VHEYLPQLDLIFLSISVFLTSRLILDLSELYPVTIGLPPTVIHAPIWYNMVEFIAALAASWRNLFLVDISLYTRVV
jgi:hypothetical protein